MSKLLYEGSEWDFDKLQRTWDVIDDMGKNQLGFDYYPAQIEIISADQMLDNYSQHAMPVMYQHWSFGKSFIQNEKDYKKGRSGLAYEVVINTNPSIAYLMETNSMTMQALVLAHASVGHSSFFKTNYLFREWSDADTIIDYLKFARSYISDCEHRYGFEEVEELLDACHSLQLNGVDKYKKPQLKKEMEQKRRSDRLEHEESSFNDLWRTVPNKKSEIKEKHEEIKGNLPEENILYFIEKYSPVLKPWQREIVRIVRKIAQYFYPQRQTSLMNEGWACYEENTEYLSESGWKKISEYAGEKIAQYGKEGKITFVQPNSYIVKHDKELLEIDSEGMNQCITPDHRMIYRSGRGHINECRADELTLTTGRKFINFGELDTSSRVGLSDIELRIMTAVCADGHFNPNTTTTHCQMVFVKPRKIERFKQLLTESKLPYQIQEQTQGRTCFSFYAPERNKELTKYWGASKEQLSIILNEAVYWDGTSKGGRTVFYGTKKGDMEFLQYASSVTGNKTSFREQTTLGNRLPLYVVEVLQSKSSTLDRGTITKLPGLHTVYCFNVPSGMLMTRRKGKITVSGNCINHYTIMNMLFDQGYIGAGSLIEALKSHSGVVYQPDWDSKHYSGINVYALGYAMMNDLKRMCLNPDKEDLYYFPDICNTDWKTTLQDVVRNYRDESFVMQFLSPKVARKFNLFSIETDEELPYHNVVNVDPEDDLMNLRKVLSAQYDLSKRVPHIEIVDVDWEGDRRMTLRHYTSNDVLLDHESLRRTGEYLHTLWGHTIKLDYFDYDGEEL